MDVAPRVATFSVAAAKLRSRSIEAAVDMPAVSFRVDAKHAQMSEIVPGLYVCGVSSLTAHNIEKHDITLIINATHEVPNVRSLGNVPRVKLWLEDTPQTSIYPMLDVQADQIEAVIAGGGNVLVHCVAGVSRSATVCLAFLTKFRCATLKQAYHMMAKKRPLVRPNIGFWRQLIAYEQDVKKSVGSVRLVRDKLHPDQIIPDVYQDEANETGSPRSDGNKENGYDDGMRYRRNSGGKLKFQPVLDPVLECVEAAA